MLWLLVVCLHQRAHSPPDPSFSVHVSACLSILHSAAPQSGFQDQSKQDVTAEIYLLSKNITPETPIPNLNCGPSLVAWCDLAQSCALSPSGRHLLCPPCHSACVTLWLPPQLSQHLSDGHKVCMFRGEGTCQGLEPFPTWGHSEEQCCLQ